MLTFMEWLCVGAACLMWGTIAVAILLVDRPECRKP